jgi:hypothetical protein
MSINAMTNAAVARRYDFEPAGRVPSGLNEIALAAGMPPTPAVASVGTTSSPQPTVAGGPGGAPPVGALAAAPVPPPRANGTNTALQTLTTYIPTEVLTLYVAAVAALGSDGQDHVGAFRPWLPFLTFLVATPIVVWVAFATKLRNASRSLPASPRTWPIWEMFAATVAFGVWAFALPDTPFARFERFYSPGLAGFMVLVVSGALGTLAPLMQRRLPS